MKKYFISIILGLVIGAFLSNLIFQEYNNYSGLKKISLDGEMVYFIKYGEYKNMKELESNTLKLANYVYTEENGKYVVYIGITESLDNANKLVSYYNNKGYKVSYNEYLITNKNYLNYLKNADKLIESTDNSAVIEEVCNQVLSKYEELVINGSKD